MNRTVSGVAAFALLLGASLVLTDSKADAGGLLAKLMNKGGCATPEPCCPAPEPVCCPEPAPSCGGGGLLAKLRARRASKCAAPEPACCPAPQPVCCEPAPACGGGGLFAKLRARRANKCCAPEPTCWHDVPAT